MIIIINIIFLGIFFLVREKYGFPLKLKSQKVYSREIQHFDREKEGTLHISNDDFIRISEKCFMHFQRMRKIKGEIWLFDILVNKLDIDDSIIISQKAKLSNGRIVLLNNKIIFKKIDKHDELNKQKILHQFNSRIMIINKKFSKYLEKSVHLQYLSSFGLWELLNYSYKYKMKYWHYLRKILIKRIDSFLLFPLISFFIFGIIRRRIDFELNFYFLISVLCLIIQIFFGLMITEFIFL